MEKGKIHIYFGDGKGKTTAAVGISVRCAGAGGRVLFAQFLKDGTSSELDMLRKLQITVKVDNFIKGFTFTMNEEEKCRCLDANVSMLSQIALEAKDYDMIVMDEITDAVDCKLLPEEALTDFLKNKHENTEVIITGRKPPQSVFRLGNYITEMRKIAHPFDSGLSARIGIEM